MSYVLTAYLVAWVEIVAVVFALSAGEWVDRVNLVAAFLSVAAAVLVAWWLSRRPRPPSLTAATRRAVRAASDPLVAVPMALSAAALLYTLGVTLTTVPNDGDPLAYELTRAAFWRQEHGIVNLDVAYVPLDYWPPVAETMLLVVMTLSGSDQLTGIPQWLAVPALALATYGVARRIGLALQAALWAASLVPVFPVVVTQSWSAFTDIVFASFAVVAVYFGIGSRRADLVSAFSCDRSRDGHEVPRPDPRSAVPPRPRPRAAREALGAGVRRSPRRRRGRVSLVSPHAGRDGSSRRQRRSRRPVARGSPRSSRPSSCSRRRSSIFPERPAAMSGSTRLPPVRS